MSDQSLIDLVSNWRWFQYVPAEARQWLADRLVMKKFSSREELYAQGDAVSYVYGVLSGSFKTYMLSPLGDETTLEEIAPGGWFPYFIPGDHPLYLTACVCVDSGTLAAAPVKVIREFGELWPRYYQGLNHEFTDRLGVIIGRIQLLSLYSLDVRLAVYLLRMIQLRGRHGEGDAFVVESVGSQSEIGARVGATRQRINSVLGGWARAGILSVTKSGFVVHDRAYLYRIVQESGFGIDDYLTSWQGGWAGAK